MKKFSAAAIGGSLGTISIWLLSELAGIVTPGEVAAAIGALLTYAVSALIPDRVEE